MAYYTGQCSNYQHLADILVEKCQAHGWAWQDNILSKDRLFVKVTVSQRDSRNAGGIIIAGGTGKQGTNLINVSSQTPRLGNPSYAIDDTKHFPARYYCFIFEDEVYLVLEINNHFYYLAFGKSSLIQSDVANGLWVTATSLVSSFSHTNNIYMASNVSLGGYPSLVAPAPFWNTAHVYTNYSNSAICHGLDNKLWSIESTSAFCLFEPLIQRMPNTTFSDSVLLPYDIYAYRPQDKISLVAQLQNIRCVRVDNFESGQIITLGHEKWMTFPFYKKNTTQRDGGAWREHSGTFGWAIRYDG